VGDLVPQLPTIFSSPARLFPQTYRGIRFVSNEIPNLQLEGFYVDEVRQRDSIRYTDVGTDNINHRFDKAATTDSFYTLGGSYQLKITVYVLIMLNSKTFSSNNFWALTANNL
jgi:hypothetical protein